MGGRIEINAKKPFGRGTRRNRWFCWWKVWKGNEPTFGKPGPSRKETCLRGNQCQNDGRSLLPTKKKTGSKIKKKTCNVGEGTVNKENVRQKGSWRWGGI